MRRSHSNPAFLEQLSTYFVKMSVYLQSPLADYKDQPVAGLRDFNVQGGLDLSKEGRRGFLEK